MKPNFFYSPGQETTVKGGNSDMSSHQNQEQGNPKTGERQDASLSDESTTSGDMDGGGGMGSGLTGGDPEADTGDQGPTPDKTSTGAL